MTDTRPLSPHIQIYRFSWTMAMSIAHRITGVGLYLGFFLLAWFLIALSGDASGFALFSYCIGSPVGEAVLFGFTWALFHHLLGGVRHALWDADIGLDAPLRRNLAQTTLVVGIILTIVTWVVGWFLR